MRADLHQLEVELAYAASATVRILQDLERLYPPVAGQPQATPGKSKVAQMLEARARLVLPEAVCDVVSDPAFDRPRG